MKPSPYSDKADEFTRLAHNDLLTMGGLGLREGILRAMNWGLNTGFSEGYNLQKDGVLAVLEDKKRPKKKRRAV